MQCALAAELLLLIWLSLGTCWDAWKEGLIMVQAICWMGDLVAMLFSEHQLSCVSTCWASVEYWLLCLECLALHLICKRHGCMVQEVQCNHAQF